MNIPALSCKPLVSFHFGKHRFVLNQLGLFSSPAAESVPAAGTGNHEARGERHLQVEAVPEPPDHQQRRERAGPAASVLLL